MDENETAEEVLRKVRRALHTPEGVSAIAQAQALWRFGAAPYYAHRRDAALQRLLDETTCAGRGWHLPWSLMGEGPYCVQCEAHRDAEQAAADLRRRKEWLAKEIGPAPGEAS